MATEQNIHSAAEWEDIPAEKFEIIGPMIFSRRPHCPSKDWLLGRRMEKTQRK